jgi:hypothetical protein
MMPWQEVDIGEMQAVGHLYRTEEDVSKFHHLDGEV